MEEKKKKKLIRWTVPVVLTSCFVGFSLPAEKRSASVVGGVLAGLMHFPFTNIANLCFFDL